MRAGFSPRTMHKLAPTVVAGWMAFAAPVVSAQVIEFGEGCPPANAPTLEVLTAPISYRPLQLRIQTVGAQIPAVLFAGTSANRWGAIPLPLQLGWLPWLGSPDCYLRVGPELAWPVVTTPDGEAVLETTAPPLGATFYMQVFGFELLRPQPLTNSRGVRVTSVAPSAPFKIVLVPDTQFYTTDDALMVHFHAQTQWIADNIRGESLVFVTHVGDVVEHGGEGGSANAVEWQRALSAWRKIEAATATEPDGPIPFAVQIGNRDYDAVDDRRSAQAFVANFDPARLVARSWWGGAMGNGRNTYQLFRANGQTFLHLGLEWRPDDTVIEWAFDVLRQHPETPTILTTHEYLDRGTGAVRRMSGESFEHSGANAGCSIYAKLVETHPQIFLVLCGHMFGDGRLTNTTALGQTVHQVLANYQGDPEGGNGWMTLIECRPDDRRIDFKTLSPTYRAGQSPGPDRTASAGNFSLPFDLASHRARLGAISVLRFRNGRPAGGSAYAGAHDTHIGSGERGVTLPNMPYGNAISLRVDADEDREQTLLRFDDLFGNRSDQIPPGARIAKAILTLTTEGPEDVASASGARLHRLLVDWNESSTWSSLGDGIQLGTEALTPADADSGVAAFRRGTASFDVTGSVRAWSAGAPVYGWVFRANGDDLWSFRSSDWPATAERPMLTVVLEKAP
jgi:hypothetical protein